jgi:5-(carboxyamino)imidazole ribonucleotide mutase
VLDFAIMKTLVSVIMGSRSDWGVMEHAIKTLESLGIEHDVRILSAHRTPDALVTYMAEAEDGGTEVFIGAAGGAAHLAGVMAAQTVLPVLGVPMESKLQGIDSLLSMVQMPAGIPVATFAVGKAGAINAALFAAAVLAATHPEVGEALRAFRQAQSEKILADPDPRLPAPA